MEGSFQIFQDQAIEPVTVRYFHPGQDNGEIVFTLDRLAAVVDGINVVMNTEVLPNDDGNLVATITATGDMHQLARGLLSGNWLTSY